MAERIERRCEEDPTHIIDHENQDQTVPSTEEYYDEDCDHDDFDDGKVPVNCPIKPMSDVYLQSLDAVKPVLQKKVLVRNLLPKLHKSRGGFLDDAERDKVESGRSNQMMMHTLITILKNKDNAALTTFCKVLEALHYIEAAEKLRMEIALRGHSKRLEDCPSEIELDKISEIVGGDYHRLLTHLGIPAATIKSFRLSNFGNAHSTCFEGLVFWREGNEPCRPATWSVLLDALEKGAGLKKYADWRRSELLSLETSCQTESLEKTHKVLKEKNAALSLSPLEAAVKELDPILAEVLSEFRHRVTQLLPKSSIYSKVRSKCQTMIARKAGVSSFNKFDVPLKVSKFVENIIKKHTTFFDIELIHEVANLLEQPTLTEAVEKYEAILKPLMTTSIGELTDRCEVMPINQDSPEGTYRLVLKFPDDANVKNLYKAKDYLEKILHIPDAKLLAFDFGCILAYFEITCTPKTVEDLPKKFTKHSSQLKAMGISGAFLIDHWAWDADSDDVWYADDESDDMEVNDQQGFLGNRKRSHLGSALGGCVEIVPSKKASQLKENCPTKKSTNDGVKRTEDMDQVQSDDENGKYVSEELMSCRRSCDEEIYRILRGSIELKNGKYVSEELMSCRRSCDEEIDSTSRPIRIFIYYSISTNDGVKRTEHMDQVEGDEEESWHTDTGQVLPHLTSTRDSRIEQDLTPPLLSRTEGQLEYKTPSDRGLYEVASQVQFARNQRILAEKLGVTLFLHQHNPLFNALKRWRDWGGGKNHPPTWRCLLDALSQTPGVKPHVRDLEERATYLTEFSLGGDCREMSSSDYHYQANLRSSKLLKLSLTRKSSTQPVLRRLARKRKNRLKAISSSTQSLNCHHRKSQRTIRTSHTSHTSSLPSLAQPQTSSVHSDPTDEVESTRMDQTDSGFSNDQ